MDWSPSQLSWLDYGAPHSIRPDYGLEPLTVQLVDNGAPHIGIPTGWTMEPLTAQLPDYGLEPLTVQLVEHRPGSKTAEASLSGQLPADQCSDVTAGLRTNKFSNLNKYIL